MIEQLSGINDILTAENETIQKQTEELSLKYQRLLQESTMNTDIITDLNIKISELQSQLKESLIPQESMDQVQTDYSAIEQQPEYGYDFDVENEITESFPPESEFDPEPEELDYDPSDLIEIKNNKNEVKKYSNFFMNFIARHFEKRFANKSIAEQDNLIFIKLMENDYEQDTVRAVKSAMKNNQELSRVDLYRLVTGRKSDNEICSFCTAVSA